MSDDWEDEDFVPPPPVVAKEAPKGLWDDEDLEDKEVKESWEQDDKPKPAAKLKADKKRKEDVKPTTETASSSDDAPLADPVAEKLRQQRLVEEADFKNAKELFGDKKEEKSLDDIIPKTEADFIEFAELAAAKITAYNKSFHYLTLLKAFLRKATAPLSAADSKDLNAALTVIVNEKLKAEKEATAGKKKTAKSKKQLNVGQGEEDDYRAGFTETQDDFDFM